MKWGQLSLAAMVKTDSLGFQGGIGWWGGESDRSRFKAELFSGSSPSASPLPLTPDIFTHSWLWQQVEFCFWECPSSHRQQPDRLLPVCQVWSSPSVSPESWSMFPWGQPSATAATPTTSISTEGLLPAALHCDYFCLPASMAQQALWSQGRVNSSAWHVQCVISKCWWWGDRSPLHHCCLIPWSPC